MIEIKPVVTEADELGYRVQSALEASSEPFRLSELVRKEQN